METIMKIADNYLILLRDAAINPNQENICYEELLKNTFIFERWDFVNAVRICKQLMDLNLFTNEIILQYYEKQLENFDNGIIPECDYFSWIEKFVSQSVYGKQRYVKEHIEREIRNGMDANHTGFAFGIKNLISCIRNAIVIKAIAKKEIEDFAKGRLTQNSLNYLLEMVEYNAP
jgi:hypothetical protein